MDEREKEHDAKLPIVTTFWNGAPCLIRCRELSPEFLQVLGGFKLLDLADLQAGRVPLSEIRAYAKQSSKILKVFLDAPSFEDLFALIDRADMAKGPEARFREIEAQIESMPPGPQRQELEFETGLSRVLFDLVFPTDFIEPLVMFAVGIEKETARKAAMGMLLELAKDAEAEGGAPSDYMPGPFTDFIREDLDRRARTLLAESREAKNMEAE
jgi:hypothetical protein